MRHLVSTVASTFGHAQVNEGRDLKKKGEVQDGEGLGDLQ